MSDTMAGILIVPFLIALVVALECSRTGCTWLTRRMRDRRTARPLAAASGISAAQEY